MRLKYKREIRIPIKIVKYIIAFIKKWIDHRESQMHIVETNYVKT